MVYRGFYYQTKLVLCPDLMKKSFVSALALVHQIFVNTSRMALAQPFRMIAYNGEINTVRGNLIG